MRLFASHKHRMAWLTGSALWFSEVAKCFLKCLSLARASGKNYLLVNDAATLQMCAAMFPAMRHCDVISFEKLATVVATCRQEHRGTMGGCLHSCDIISDVRDAHSDMEELNWLMRDTDMTPWSIWLRGVTCQARGEERFLALGETSKDFEDFLSSLPEIRFHGTQMLENRWGSVSTLPASCREGSIFLFSEFARNNSFEKYDPPGHSLATSTSSRGQHDLARLKQSLS